MHTFEWGREPESWYFHHEGDFTGEVIVANVRGEGARIPCAALIAFAAEFIRCKKIQELESASDREIFGLKPKS